MTDTATPEEGTQQEAEKVAHDSHHSNTINLICDFNIDNLDFSDDLTILDDAPSGSKGPHSSFPTSLRNQTGPQERR